MPREDPAAQVPVIACDTIGSTNAEALALACRGERGPLWITARRQTAGRGRRGRTWSSEPGNLYASLLLSEPSPPERAAGLSFVAALAVHDAIAEIGVPAHRLAIKWPNDVLCKGAKIAGILIEGQGPVVVVGVGINCQQHPSDARYPATNLAACGVRVSPQRLFEVLASAMHCRLTQWERGSGFASIRSDWLERVTGIGSDVHVAIAERDVLGRFEAIDETGRLVLRLPDGRCEAIAAADVFPLGVEQR
jgi:BirA family biotin operon repressor/biotin-[acetyl-CoA-carboxylase] ligase